MSGRALATVVYGSGPDGEAALGCAACRRELAPMTGNYRLGSSWLELEMTELGTNFIDPLEQVGAELRWRSYLCPGCGIALDGEVCRPGDEPVWDVRLDPHQPARS